MTKRRATARTIPLIILLLLSACESPAPDADGDQRSEARGLSATLSITATAPPVLPTRDLHDSGVTNSGQTSAATRTPLIMTVPVTHTSVVASAQATETRLPVTPLQSATPLIAPLPSKTPTLLAEQATLPSVEAQPLFTRFTVGTSVEGRELIGYRIGNGSKLLLLVGAVHGGFEANSAELVDLLAGHFREHPGDILPDMTLLLVPMLNPDGVARGRVLAGRFNANGVDLNRNWGCGWSSVAYFRQQTVSAGSAAFSEPETQALSALIQMTRPAAALFFHAAANGVFAGDCGGDAGSGALSEIYGRASEYDFGADFSAYPVTGTAAAWVNSLGIPAADVELASATDPEFDRNLRGVMAVQYWLMER